MMGKDFISYQTEWIRFRYAKVGPFLVAIRTPGCWKGETCKVRKRVRIRVWVRVRVRCSGRVRLWDCGIPVSPQHKLGMQPR